MTGKYKTEAIKKKKMYRNISQKTLSSITTMDRTVQCNRQKKKN